MSTYYTAEKGNIETNDALYVYTAACGRGNYSPKDFQNSFERESIVLSARNSVGQVPMKALYGDENEAQDVEYKKFYHAH